MGKASDYNKAELVTGRLTIEHVTKLVELYQSSAGLDADGMFGPKTRACLDALISSTSQIAVYPRPGAFKLGWPLPKLADGREPQITSSFRPKDRLNHDGIDLFYRWRAGDKPDFVGDKGCAGKNPDGSPKWCVPYGTNAIAAADGIVQIAGNSATGFRLWIDHGNGLRTGYFHLINLLVSIGQRVSAKAPLGMIGDNPKDHDGRHLHFELSPADRYAPIDPAPYLR